MRRLILFWVFAALSCNAAAEWVIVNDHDEYVAYADPASIQRDGDKVTMSDLIDHRSQRSSPLGNLHVSSTAHSEFDCGLPRMRTIAFTLYAGQMGNGEVVEAIAEYDSWIPVAPGTLLNILWQFACGTG